jgi:hypothetical protein
MKKMGKQGKAEKGDWRGSCGEGLFFEQIGVSAGAVGSNGFGVKVNFVDKHPIALNMAVYTTFPFSLQ